MDACFLHWQIAIFLEALVPFPDWISLLQILDHTTLFSQSLVFCFLANCSSCFLTKAYPVNHLFCFSIFNFLSHLGSLLSRFTLRSALPSSNPSALHHCNLRFPSQLTIYILTVSLPKNSQFCLHLLIALTLWPFWRIGHYIRNLHVSMYFWLPYRSASVFTDLLVFLCSSVQYYLLNTFGDGSVLLCILH